MPAMSAMRILRSALAGVLTLSSLIGGSIGGRVTSSVTGTGIPGVDITVCLSTSPGALCRSRDLKKAVTDENGVFRISDLPDGQYSIMLDKDGFSRQDLTPSPLRVFGDARLDLQMVPPANILGKVLDPQGKPITGITVKLLDARTVARDENITDANGEFAFKDEYPGTYTLSATPKPQATGKDGVSTVTTYYPSVVDRDQALRVELQGTDLVGYDIRLKMARAHTVRGVVRDPEGKPAPHAKVAIFKPASGIVTTLRGPWFPEWSQSQEVAAADPVETKEDGTFAFPPVLEGEWTVRATLMHEDLQKRDAFRSAAVPVSVSRNDIENLEIHLAQPFQMEVSADWGDSPPPSDSRPLFSGLLMPLDSQPLTPTDVKPGQLSSYKVFSGRYFLQPGGKVPGYYAGAVLLDNRDVLGQVVNLSGPATLTVVLKTDGGAVRGTVEKGADALLVLLADATPVSRPGFSAFADPDGSFLIRDVPPGAYTIAAMEKAEMMLPYSDFISAVAANGTRVKVEAGASVSIDLRMGHFR